MNKTHCGKQLTTRREKNECVIECVVCKKKWTGKTPDEAWASFGNKIAIIARPQSASQMPIYIKQHSTELVALVSPVVDSKPAMKRLIDRNTRYIMKSKNLVKSWGTEAGQESIIKGYEDALCMGAELGKMGDLVPYGEVVEFIPSVEAFEFALTNGSSSPFEWIKIEPIYDNDTIKSGRKDMSFFLDFEEIGSPRGKVKQIAVYGKHRKTGLVEGEIYDASRLIEKAATHSTSYKSYLQDKRSFEVLRSEGKTKAMNGREYFEKEIHKKNGGTWTKKIFIDELTNPYEGADQPEMLRKSAGKSFLGRYSKVRNSEAAINELKEQKDDPTIEDTIDDALDSAMDVFDDIEVEVEIVEEEPTENSDGLKIH